MANKNTLEIAKKLRKSLEVDEFEALVQAAEGIAKYVPEKVDDVVEIVKKLENERDQEIFLSHTGEILACGGLYALDRARQFVTRVPCIAAYSAEAAPKIIGLKSNIKNLEHCEALAIEMGSDLRPFDKLGESGDLGSVIGAFVENYRPMLDLSGKAFIKDKVRSFERAVKKDKQLCVKCGINFFEIYQRRRTFIDHSAFGRVSEGAVARLMDYINTCPDG